MCVTSATIDSARTIPLQQWTYPAWTEFQEILRRLEALDAKLGQPDCEDPKKAAWMRAVEKRLAKLEGTPV